MSTVPEIIDAVRGLSEHERTHFLDQLRQLEFDDAWDRQMDADAATGKLNFLVKEAEEAMQGGMLQDWPGRTE